MGQLQATLDLEQHVVLQTLYMLYLRAEYTIQDELYFLLALLNSRLLQEYVYVLYTAYKWVQPQIEQHVLAQLPIPVSVDPSEKALIIKRARLLMQVCSTNGLRGEYNVLYEEQERAICALYTIALAADAHSF
jgi:hypothetical protein